MQLSFFTNTLPWASGDNLGLKCSVNCCIFRWDPREAKALQSTKSGQRALKLIQIITQSEMSFLQNFCQTYTQCRHNSLNYCNGNMLFLQWKVIWVQSLLFFRNISLTRFFSCSQLQESSQQPQLRCHFVFKVNFEEGFLSSKIFCGLLTQ